MRNLMQVYGAQLVLKVSVKDDSQPLPYNVLVYQ